MLFKSLLGRKETRSRIISALSGCSFCVYLAHPLVLMEAQELWFNATGLYNPASIPQQLALYLGVLAACVLGALVLASIPGLCRIFTGQSFQSACRNSNLFALIRRREQ